MWSLWFKWINNDGPFEAYIFIIFDDEGDGCEGKYSSLGDDNWNKVILFDKVIYRHSKMLSN